SHRQGRDAKLPDSRADGPAADRRVREGRSLSDDPGGVKFLREQVMSDTSSADTAEFPKIEDLLEKHFGPSPPRVKVEFGALADQGRVRTNNEDHYLVI